ncbi:MAG: winged helix-turn-helix domain-containing protein [Desulfobacteraceae bacterium]|nr:MAG: winged helix-turn-helix domain-containing protein [Desulfobacteraceae bacterium]
MEQTEAEKKARLEQMKDLRLARKATIQASAVRVSAQTKTIKAIKEQLKDEPKTVPEISEAASLPAVDVLYFLATLKKFGQVIEAEQDGSYFRYGLAEGVISESAD